MCLANPVIFFDTCLWTYNPRNEPGFRNLPFILRPQQEVAVMELKKAIETGYDLLFDKSRDEGATEIIIKTYLLYFLLCPESSFLVGSRKEDYVDGATSIDIEKERVTGSPRSIFHKALYGLAHLPYWMKPKILKTHCHIENLENGSIIDGEATNENFGAGDRRTSVMLDEFGRVDHRIAQSIRETISDTTDCTIYNSTHFYGRGHPFGRLRFSGKIKVVVLPWYKNPVKAKGLYKSPDLNVLEIHDLDYYKQLYPKVFGNVKIAPYIVTYSELEKDFLINYPQAEVRFVADGSNKWRSPWYDSEERRRDPRDVAQNIDMNPLGAGDMFFDPEVLNRIRSEFVKPPAYKGEIEYTLGPDGKLTGIRFAKGWGKKRFSWWGKLVNGRPDQSHNYIVACDISLGTGASNSVAGVYDADTGEKIGLFVCPNSPPETFCDYVIALCHWVGGATKRPFLIWEANGPGGSFDKRRKLHGYTFCYRMTNERTMTRTHQKRYGWYSNRQTKYDLLLELRIALSEGLKSTSTKRKRLIVYDEATVSEYEDYVFYENGDIGLSTCVDESSGAKAAHGDRVIADGLAILAMSEQTRAIRKLEKRFEYGSFSFRRLVRKWEKENKDKNSPFL